MSYKSVLKNYPVTVHCTSWKEEKHCSIINNIIKDSILQVPTG